MAGKLNRGAYQQLVDEDVAWLERQPRTLERDHVIAVVKESVDAEYGKVPEPPATTPRYALNPHTHQYECSCGAPPANLHFIGDRFLGCDACLPRDYAPKVELRRRFAERAIKIGPARDDELASLRQVKFEEERLTRMAFDLLRTQAEADALAAVLRERIYPSDNDGEPLERCLDSIGEHGRPTQDRCSQPRTYDFHCDEHRRPHEKEERNDAPLIRALAAHDASRASYTTDAQAYVDRVAALEAALAEERRLRSDAETRAEILSTIELDPTNVLLDELGIELHPGGRLPERVRLALAAADARLATATARVAELEQVLRHRADQAQILASATTDLIASHQRDEARTKALIRQLQAAIESLYGDLAMTHHGHEVDGSALQHGWSVMTEEQRARCNAAFRERIAVEEGETLPADPPPADAPATEQGDAMPSMIEKVQAEYLAYADQCVRDAQEIDKARAKIAQDMRQLQADADHWNRTHPDEEPIVIDPDLSKDVEAARAAPQADAEPK